jgi:hypothetical protein
VNSTLLNPLSMENLQHSQMKTLHMCAHVTEPIVEAHVKMDPLLQPERLECKNSLCRASTRMTSGGDTDHYNYLASHTHWQGRVFGVISQVSFAKLETMNGGGLWLIPHMRLPSACLIDPGVDFK